MAYGLDPSRKEFYSLRQARYDALAEDLATLALTFAARGERMRVLDIGPYDGVALRHLEGFEGHEAIDYSIADVEIYPDFYKLEQVAEIFIGDLTGGYPEIPSNHYHVVVCEQVLEHLTQLETPIRTLERVLKPGGTLIVGVPTFPHGFHYMREYGQAPWDRVFPPNKVRGHVNTFSKRKLLRMVAETTSLRLTDVRGFRIMSGGVLRRFEEYEGYWRFARWIGRTLPGLCIEIQAVFVKPAPRA